MNFTPPNNRRDISSILTIMENLRDPNGGCPWDLKQDNASIAPYAVEEAYELVDAIERGNVADTKDELGDVLLQVVFHAQMASEDGKFDFADVVEAVSNKMVRRHPHVFKQDGADVYENADNADQVVQNWEDIKAAEKAAKAAQTGGSIDGFTSILADVPTTLPASTRAVKLQKKAAKVGFDWPNLDGVMDKIREEIDELETEINAGDSDKTEAEFGDVLFSLMNLARKLKIDPETALRRTNNKFTSRFAYVEQQVVKSGKAFDAYNLDELDLFWEAAKKS